MQEDYHSTMNNKRAVQTNQVSLQSPIESEQKKTVIS